MNLTSGVLIFILGLIAGLGVHFLARAINSGTINSLIAAVDRLVVSPLSLVKRIFRRRSEAEGQEELSRTVDAREQQINDSAQIIRSILLRLAADIQRTDTAASESSQVLGDVKINLTPVLTEAHSVWVREIDRVIASNSVLKAELAKSQKALAEQRRQIEDLRTAVRIDGLTQLANRAYFDQKLTEMIKLHQRYPDEVFSLMMVDVDNFKQINDTYGHQAGDRVLKGVALKIKATLRGSDFMARFGGDEFALILIRTDAKAASEVAWKLCNDVRGSRFLLDNTSLAMTLSIGVAEVRSGDTEESLFRRADEALYRVKERGRNNVSVV